MYDCGGFLSIVNAQDEGIKDNHPNGILIKMMRGPFSHQDTKTEEASPKISFLMSGDRGQSTKQEMGPSEGRKNKTAGGGRREAHGLTLNAPLPTCQHTGFLSAAADPLLLLKGQLPPPPPPRPPVSPLEHLFSARPSCPFISASLLPSLCVSRRPFICLKGTSLPGLGKEVLPGDAQQTQIQAASTLGGWGGVGGGVSSLPRPCLSLAAWQRSPAQPSPVLPPFSGS